jgi:DNA polymerase-1
VKLLAIDYSNLLIRHALNPYNREDEQGVGGVSGSLRQILSLWKELQPTHLLVAKDSASKNLIRKQIDPKYKEGRATSKVNIRQQFKVAEKALELMQFPQLTIAQYEADDVLASAATSFPGETVVVSGDKDMLALCSWDTTVRLLRPGGFVDCSPVECVKLFGIPPDKICDYKAIAGDKSDGISGVPGIGDKGAIELLQAHGSFSNLQKIVEQDGELAVSPRLNKLFREHIEQAIISYQLAELVSDLNLPDAKEWVYHKPPTDQQIGQQLENLDLNHLRRMLDGFVDTSFDDFAAAFSS